MSVSGYTLYMHTYSDVADQDLGCVEWNNEYHNQQHGIEVQLPVEVTRTGGRA